VAAKRVKLEKVMSESSDDSDISRYLDHSDSESKSKQSGIKAGNSNREDAERTLKVKKEHSVSSEAKTKSSMLILHIFVSIEM